MDRRGRLAAGNVAAEHLFVNAQAVAACGCSGSIPA